MAKSDERWKLGEVVERLERLVRDAKNSPAGIDASTLIANLESTKDRMAIVEHEIKLADEEKRQLSERQLAIVCLTQRETALSQSEREQYGAFLASEYFTKNDFGGLAEFYTNTWDRLSEEGKAQMSYRVWEGVRRHEYQFSELPDPVKEKEAQRLYEALKLGSQKSPELNRIPAGDTDDFVKAWEGNRKQEAYQVLNRPVFAGNVAVTTKTNDAGLRGHATVKDAASIRGTDGQPIRAEEAKEIMGTVDLTETEIRIPDADSKTVAPTRLSEPKSVAKSTSTPGD